MDLREMAAPWSEPDLSLLDEPRPDVPPFPIAVLPALMPREQLHHVSAL